MVNLDDSPIFVKVAQVESISQAARSLGTPASAVSPRLSVLEPNLGVSLLTAHDATGDSDCAGFGEDCSKSEPGGGQCCCLHSLDARGLIPLVGTLSFCTRGHPLLGAM